MAPNRKKKKNKGKARCIDFISPAAKFKRVQDSIVHYGGFLIDDGGSDSPPPSSSSSSSDTGSTTTTSTSTSNSGYNSDSSKSISSKDFDKNSRKRNKYFQANGFYNESTKRGKHPILKRNVVRKINGVYCIRSQHSGIPTTPSMHRTWKNILSALRKMDRVDGLIGVLPSDLSDADKAALEQDLAAISGVDPTPTAQPSKTKTKKAKKQSRHNKNHNKYK